MADNLAEDDLKWRIDLARKGDGELLAELLSEILSRNEPVPPQAVRVFSRSGRWQDHTQAPASANTNLQRDESALAAGKACRTRGRDRDARPWQAARQETANGPDAEMVRSLRHDSGRRRILPKAQT